MSVGESLLHALCEEGDASVFFKYRLEEGLFQGDEVPIFKFIENHVEKYLTLPQIETLLAQFPDIALSPEPTSYYLDKVDQRHKYRRLNLTLKECSDLMKAQDVDTAMDRLSTLTNELTLFDKRMDTADFGQDAYNIIASSLTGDGKEGVNFGWPYLDNMVQGLRGGDVVSYVGRPAVGKTWQLMYSALNAWKFQKRNVMVLSMEMIVQAIAQRLAALETGISIGNIKGGILAKHSFGGGVDEKSILLSKLKKLQSLEQKLHIIDGNLNSTPEEIFALASQLKPDVVFIDGAYLLKHANPRMDRFTRVAENIEQIKRFTTEMGIPTVCSYQFNREAGKKKNTSEITLDQIGYSDAIGQISSVVLGLFDEESVETLQSRTIRVLKGRDGATGQFNVRWDFDKMDFSEIPEAEENWNLAMDHM